VTGCDRLVIFEPGDAGGRWTWDLEVNANEVSRPDVDDAVAERGAGTTTAAAVHRRAFYATLLCSVYVKT